MKLAQAATTVIPNIALPEAVAACLGRAPQQQLRATGKLRAAIKFCQLNYKLEPLLSLLLQTLLGHNMCHGCYLSLYPATAIADISGAKHVPSLLPQFVTSYCYCRYYWCTVYAMAATSSCNQLLELQILLVHSMY